MKIKQPYGKTPSPWPDDKAGVLRVAQNWMDESRVKINTQAIDAMPAGYIQAPKETDLILGNTAVYSPHALADAIAFSVAMNSINHMFWSLDEKGKFKRYEKDGAVGAMLMTGSFRRAWGDDQSPLRQAHDRGVALTAQDIHTIFGEIPGAQGRVDILNEVLIGDKLQKISAQLSSTATLSGGLDTSHASLLAKAFPLAYGDEVLKKAQLAVSAVWRNAQELGLSPTCELTAFADYQVPNVLRALGLLEYAPDLAEKIDRFQLIAEHSVDENALRGASVLAVERLAAQQGVHVADVDYWLWSKRKEPKTPFHLTETTAY